MMKFPFLRKFLFPWRSLKLSIRALVPMVSPAFNTWLPATYLFCKYGILLFLPFLTQKKHIIKYVVSSWYQSLLLICGKHPLFNKSLLIAYPQVDTVLGPADKAVNTIQSPSCIIAELRYCKFPNQPRQMFVNAPFFVVFFLLNEKWI